MTLTPADFADFVAAVHPRSNDGRVRSPFPWQQALLARVLSDGWPAVIDVPTGLGKTSILDVSVFTAALQPRSAPRRTFFVVDRRIVVDEAYEHAKRISAALHNGTDRVVRAVASALRQPGDDVEDEGPLEVARMRGGVTWEARWVERPDRFAIVTGTVDQVGSRLLFRGYGVGERARSIDAALVGTDSLIVIDEAHLAQPLLETMAGLADLDAHPIGREPVLVTMSATTTSLVGEDQVHRMSPEDEAHPVAGPRLRAPKRMNVVEVKTSRANADAVMAEALANMALKLAPGRVVGVVVNTVARARAVFDRIGDPEKATLLIGRSRPIDREYLLAHWLPRIGVDREKPTARPAIVVATQTIEVGANVDFDVLVTESAPWSSLVQRLGRLNRLGDAESAIAVVLHPTSTDDDDPVYGPARVATWNWLAARTPPTPYTGRMDPTQLDGGTPASPLALRALTPLVPDEARIVLPATPILDESTLDAWVRTSPAPHPDPPIEPFLHGRRDVSPGVQIVWRADLPEDSRAWSASVDQLPPVADESLEVPVRAVRRWLAGQVPDPTVNDDEAASTPEPDEPDQLGRSRVVLRYRSRTDRQVVPSGDVRPGDLIVVPSSYGGCDRYGWNPLHRQPVIDVADLAWRRGKPALRVSDRLSTVVGYFHRTLLGTPGWTALQQARAESVQLEAADGDAYDKAIRVLCEHIEPDQRQLPLARNLIRLAASRKPKAVLLDNDDVLLSTGRVAIDDDSAGTSSASGRMGLDPHQRAVAKRAGEFARNLGLPQDLVSLVELAARWHDEGKRDHRFQIMLWGGDALRADLATQPLAKSGMDPSDQEAMRQALVRSGYPPGMRHEALSARIVALRLGAVEHASFDHDLVIHLAASHHGCGRPLLPPVLDPAPLELAIDGLGTVSTVDTVDWEGPARFGRLNDRYGRWGLALLETIVRLADIWCSARNEEAS